MESTRRLGRHTQQITYRENSDLESGSEESDYEVQQKPTRKRKNTTSSTTTTTKRSKLRKIDLDQAEADLPENHLNQALIQPDVDVLDLALEWIESYVEDTETNNNESITVLINLLLRGCGSVHIFEPHDLVNLESAAETVGEISIAFGEQQMHKYPFKAFPNFKKNVLAFFEHLIRTAHEKGLLYKYEDDDEESLSSPLMTQILTWISSLSSCVIRPLRYVSTVILLTIQNELCQIMNTIVSSLEKSQRQLAKTTKKNKSRLDTVNKTIQSYQNQKETIIEYFNEIGNITLGHRYRDIDPIIRQECLKYLSQAMIIYPDHYFQATFLRYYGWLLADPSNTVRLEVTKVLLKLYRSSESNSGLNIGFRQFTERYKQQLIKMSKADEDPHVRLNSISISCQLLRIGFLDELDKSEIISIFFEIPHNRVSKTNEQKIRTELARFVAILNQQNINDEIEKYTIFIENYESPQFGNGDGQLQIKECLRVKNLVQILSKASELYPQNEILDTRIVSSIYSALYQLTAYENSWEFLIRYLLFDSSALEFKANNEDLEENSNEVEGFKQMLELSSQNERVYLLSFILGALSTLSQDKTKKGQDDYSDILVKLVNYLPSIYSRLKSSSETQVFLSIWHLLINTNNEASNIYSIFKNMDQLRVYNDITIGLLKFYQTLEIHTNTGMMEDFDNVFSKLLESYSENEATGINTLTQEIRLQVQNLCHELVSEAKEVLETSPSSGETGHLKWLLTTATDISKPLAKLSKLGDYVDINNFLKTTDLTPTIVTNILEKLDLESQIDSRDPTSTTKVETLTSSVKVILDFILVTTSWNLERLMAADRGQSHFDIRAIFQDVNDAGLALINGIGQFNLVIATVLDSDVVWKYSLIEKLADFKTLFVAKLVDIISSIKIFYVKFKDQNDFASFNRFFGSDDTVGSRYVTRVMPEGILSQFLDLFLYKEAKLARELDVELERTAEEDVNIEDLVAKIVEGEEDVESEVEAEESGEEGGDDAGELSTVLKKQAAEQRKQARKWAIEKDLCVYSLKLFKLTELSIVDDDMLERLKLNGAKLGGIFSKIIVQNQPHAPVITGGVVPEPAGGAIETEHHIEA